MNCSARCNDTWRYAFIYIIIFIVIVINQNHSIWLMTLLIIPIPYFVELFHFLQKYFQSEKTCTIITFHILFLFFTAFKLIWISLMHTNYSSRSQKYVIFKYSARNSFTFDYLVLVPNKIRLSKRISALAFKQKFSKYIK